jgi:integrase
MPSLHQDPLSSVYRIRFRYHGRQINRSLRTKERRAARAACDRVGEMLDLVERGLVSVPPSADPIAFVLSDGRVERHVSDSHRLGLADFFATYQERLPEGRKEPTTLKGERLHVRHFQRHLGVNRVVQSITKANLQEYVVKRLKERHRGRPIRPDTVRKELVTFRMLWNWGVEEGLLTGRAPTKHVVLPLIDEKPPFMTRTEIEAVVRRGSLSEDEQCELWKALFLEREEIAELLKHAEKTARLPAAYPMLVFVAHTGARRSEIVRARIEDLDFRARTVLIREKKKSRSKAMTYRRIDMSPLLERVMKRWVEAHIGGQHVFSQPDEKGRVTPLTIWQADHHLKKSLCGSKWQIIRGFHVFRHSFASNLAMAGVADKVIDEWMGHQTTEMRQRYRHLFPRERRSAIDAAFGP